MPRHTKPKPPKRKRGGQKDNTNADKHGFYSDKFTPEELARIAEYVSDPTPSDEIFMLRVLNRRVLAYAKDHDDLATLKSTIEILSTSTGRIGTLLRIKHVLTGKSGDEIADAIGKILDELAVEWGIEL